MRLSRIPKTAVAIAAAAAMTVAVAVPAGAAPHRWRDPDHPGRISRTSTCTGTIASPGVLAGNYPSNVIVTGVCFVNGGAATIAGDLIVAPGGALNASFALNDVSGSGTSSLTVRRDVLVESGGILFMGCEPNFSICSDDPDQTVGTLTGQNAVGGNLLAVNALGVIVHASTVGGSVTQLGGGGGVSCNPPAGSVFEAIGSPAFSDYEDNTINGNLSIVGLQTCWLGALRDHVRGSMLDVGNNFADPDANEAVSNVINGAMICLGNNPAVAFGDSGGVPNVVGGFAFGECGFNSLSPNPAPNGPLTPISVRAS